MKYGFITYIKPQVPVPTAQEIFDGLTGSQKLAILNEYADNGSVALDITRLKRDHKILGAKTVVPWLYDKFEGMRLLSITLCRGEFVTQEATYDPEGNELTPAQYNPIPQSASELALGLRLEQYGGYGQFFTAGEITVFVNTMVDYSEADADGNYIGTWSSYFNSVIA